MEIENLLKKYPNLIEKCREWDCCYSEAIERIEEMKRNQSLERFL